MQEGGPCARQRGPGAERPVCQAGRPVCRDEGQAKQRCLFSQNKITQFPQVQAYRDSQILIKRFMHKGMRNSRGCGEQVKVPTKEDTAARHLERWFGN